MKVLLINGNPKKNGNTFLALSEVTTVLNNNGVETEIISIGAKAVQGCIACLKCFELGRCVFKDDLYNSLRESLKDAEDNSDKGAVVFNYAYADDKADDGDQEQYRKVDHGSFCLFYNDY